MIIRKVEIETIMENKRDFNEDEWLVYGHSDILKTKILKNDFDIKMMYSESLNYDNHFKQVFYLFNENNDEEFWTKAKTFDFSGVYFIFLDYPENDNEKKSLKKCVSDHNIGYDPNKMQIYETLDNYDGIIVFHGSSPNIIQNEMNTFLNTCSEKGIFVKDMYKMFMSCHEKINSEDENEEENLSLQIQIVLKQSDCLNNALELMNNTIKSAITKKITDISGSNHLNIYIDSISKKDLFSLYKSKEPIGVLAINSEYRTHAIKTTRLKFMLDFDKSIKYIKRTSLTELSKKFKSKLEKLKIENNEINDFYKAQLDRIENSMQHILTNNLPDYSFLALYPSLINFLEKVRSNYPFEEKDNCVRYFLEAAKEIINMSDGIQIGYYLLQSYICKEVFAPSELISFYSAFLWEFNKKILSMQNDKDSQFVFCLEPSLKANVQIKGLFLDDKKVQDRLLLVYIPMKYFYNPKIMLFSLCHEGSHYVGEVIRCRNERAKYINTTYTYWLIDQLCLNMDATLIDEYSIREKIIDRYQNYVKLFSEKYHSSKYSQDLKNILSLSTKSLLTDLSYEMINIFKYPYDKDDENFVKRIKDIHIILKNIKNNSKSMLINGEYDEIIENIIYVYSEAFSDKLAKMVLNVDEKQYIEIIKESYGVQDVSEINEDFIILRVLANYYSSNVTIPFMNGRIGKYETIYSQFLKLENGSSYLTLPSLFENPAMLKCLIDYLECCGKKFNEYFNRNENIFLKLRQSMTGEFNLDIIKKFNKEYREDIHKVINELNIN